MPLAAVISDRVFCVHGGLSPSLNSLEEIINIQRPLPLNDGSGLAIDLLWSDPHPSIEDWEENYDKLVAYHKKFGHSNVPQNDVHGKLARWCYLQKRQRELRRLGASEIRLLDRMDFDWTYVRKTGKRPTFEDKCRELQAFKKKYGDCDVPVSGKHILLGQWLYCMKRRRLGVYKRCRQLTQDQIDQLEAIGINWAFSWGDNTSAVNERNNSSGSSDESDDDTSLE